MVNADEIISNSAGLLKPLIVYSKNKNSSEIL